MITEGLQINEAHSGYVEMFLTLGWIGVALWGALIATGYRNVIAAYRGDPDAGGLRIAWFLAPLITGFTEAAFRMMGLTWVVFLLATANSRWDAGRKTGHRDRPTTRQLQWPSEEPRSVPEEVASDRQQAAISHEPIACLSCSHPMRTRRASPAPS